MIEYLILILAAPLGIILRKLTNDEKNIYSKIPYFPIILWILLISSAVFYFIEKTIALSLTFTFIMVFFWNKK